MDVRLLGPGDEAIVARLVEEDADFDLDGRDGSDVPADLVAYLADPAVLHWVAEDDGDPVGHLHCTIVRLSYGPGRELLLYEIGVREAWRRRGVGRALVDAMTTWMAAEDIAEVWVLADNPGARDFYAAVGFTIDEEQPTYMTRG
ncbi:MAG: GCN5-related N-acetyltransferase [Actinomycetia bacterium]|nr:GCN5-related N-acetyltransferase [Actinomycetes bacterium]